MIKTEILCDNFAQDKLINQDYKLINHGLLSHIISKTMNTNTIFNQWGTEEFIDN